MVTKTTIADSRRQAVHITGSDNLVTVTANASVISSTDEGAIYFDANTRDNDVVVKGHLFGGTSGVSVRSVGSSVQVTSGAEVTGANGIQCWAAANISVKNAGVINGTGNGSGFAGGGVLISGQDMIDPTDNATVINTGQIFGLYGVLVNGDAQITNGAAGRIIGSSLGIDVANGAADIVNHGVVSAIGQAALQATGDARTAVINDGTMNGNVDLGGGNDKFDNRGGVVNGQILGGTGDDVLITDKSGVTLTENADEGLDTVRSSVSYTLNANVEVLRLSGKADINGTATDTTGTVREYLLGNGGNNTLKGLGGRDVLDGGAGKDILAGGGDLDLFVFKKGYGNDTVRDFHAGEGDVIILEKFKNLGDIDNLTIDQHGKDAWIVMGHGDTLVLKNVDADHLTNHDFAW
jgi:Ca2+-binding RTX toxin-like protein